MRAIWAAWNDGEKLDFRGEFYTHTLMTPFFDPGPEPVRAARRCSSPRSASTMTEVAGEVADGMILHAFTTERYVREVTLPALERGFAKAGAARADFELSAAAVRRDRDHRRGVGGRAHGHQAADRVLRLDARLPRRARAARLGRPRHRAQPSSRKRGRVGGDGRAHHRRDARDLRGGRRARRRRRRASSPATATSSTASLRRALQVGPRGVDGACSTSSRPPVDRRRRACAPPNSAFYAALEARDLDAMAEVWEHSDRIVVTHPGWPMLRGLGEGRGIVGRDLPQHRLHPVRAHRRAGDGRGRQRLGHARREHPAERRQTEAADELSGSKATSVNVFVRDQAEWKHGRAPRVAGERGGLARKGSRRARSVTRSRLRARDRSRSWR